MSYFNVGHPETLVECPYNKAHMVRNKRMQYHLIDCRKQYIGQDMKICPYNAKHVHPSAEHQFHLVHCPDRMLIDRDIVHSCQEKYECIPDKAKGSTSVPPYDLHIDADEDWDIEACAEPFTLLNAMAFTRPIPVLQPTNSTNNMRLPRENPPVFCEPATSRKDEQHQTTATLDSRRQPRLCNAPPLQLSSTSAEQVPNSSHQSAGCSTVASVPPVNSSSSTVPVPVAGRGRAIMTLLAQVPQSVGGTSSKSAVKLVGCGRGQSVTQTITHEQQAATAAVVNTPAANLLAARDCTNRPTLAVRQATSTAAFSLPGVGRGSQPTPPSARDLPLPAFGRCS